MNKTVLVSGANGGIGNSIVSYLINNDYKVIALDLDNSNISKLDCVFIKCDVTNKNDLENAYKEVQKLTPNLYAIINTVGVFKMRSLIEGSEEEFRKILEINFFGIYSLNKIMFPLLEKGSRIINQQARLQGILRNHFKAIII